MDITSKFTIASDEGLNNLLFLRNAQIIGMYKGSIEEDKLNQYIEKQLNQRDAINELNNLSTQMITVFAKDVPIGYAIIKQSNNPEVLKGLKVIKYASFYIIPKHDRIETRESLWKKCLTITQTYDALWIEMLQNDPLVPFLENCGFEIHESSKMIPFGKPSYIMIRLKKMEDKPT